MAGVFEKYLIPSSDSRLQSERHVRTSTQSSKGSARLGVQWEPGEEIPPLLPSSRAPASEFRAGEGKRNLRDQIPKLLQLLHDPS